MFGAKLSSVLASGILLLGSGAIALAQGAGPSEPPEQASERAHADAGAEVGTLVLVNETATAWSQWVSENPLGLEGCQRGQTIAKYARQGPHEFDPSAVTPVPEDELPGRCATGDGGDEVESEGRSNGPPDHAGRPDHAGQPGPPPHAGGADEAGASSDAGPPDDAGPPSEAGSRGGR